MKFDDHMVTSSSWSMISSDKAQQEAMLLLYVRISRQPEGCCSAPCAVGIASRELLAHAGGVALDVEDEDRIARKRDIAAQRREQKRARAA